MEHLRRALPEVGEPSSVECINTRCMPKALSARDVVKEESGGGPVKSAAFAIRDRVAARQRLVRTASVPNLSPRIHNSSTRKLADDGEDDGDDVENQDYEAPLRDGPSKPRRCIAGKSTKWFYDLHVPDSNQLTPVSEVSMDDWLFDLKASQQMLDHERSQMGPSEEEMINALDCALQVGDFITVDTWMSTGSCSEAKGEKIKKHHTGEKKKSKKKKKEKKEKKSKLEARELAEEKTLTQEVISRDQTQPDTNVRVDSSFIVSYINDVTLPPTSESLVEFSCHADPSTEKPAMVDESDHKVHVSRHRSKGSDSSNSSSSRNHRRSRRHSNERGVKKERSSRRRHVHRQSSLPNIMANESSKEDSHSHKKKSSSSSRRRRRSSSRDLSRRQASEPILKVQNHSEEPHHDNNTQVVRRVTSSRELGSSIRRLSSPYCSTPSKASSGDKVLLKRHKSVRESSSRQNSRRTVVAEESLSIQKIRRSHRRSSM